MADGSYSRRVPPPPPEEQTDFRRLKILEARHNAEWRWRLPLFAVVVLVFWWYYHLSALLVLFAVDVAVNALHARLVGALPEHGSARQIRPVLATLLLRAVLTMAAGLLLWSHNDDVFRLFSMLLLVVSALNTLTRCGLIPLLVISDLAVICLGVAGRVAMLWWEAPSSPATVTLSLCLIAVSIYFVRVVLDVVRMRKSIDRAIALDMANQQRHALTRFTGGVAHDFNNLLTAVLGNVELARLAEMPAERDELMSEAEKAARRGAELTGQLLALSSKSRLQPVTLRPELIQRHVAEVAEQLMPVGRCALSVTAEENLPAVHVDEAKIESALLELMSNACMALTEAAGKGEEKDRNITFALRASDTLGGPGVCFEVADTGDGIPPEALPLVFEPYFTTRPVGRGSGLGLPMVRGIVEQSGGRLVLTSTEGEGTCAQVHLPGAPTG